MISYYLLSMSDLGLRGRGSRELLVPFGMMKKFREWWWLYNIVSVLNVTELQNMLRNHYSKIGRKRSSSYPRRQHELKFQMIYGQWPLIGYLYKGHCIGTPTLQPLHNPSTSSIWQGSVSKTQQLQDQHPCTVSGWTYFIPFSVPRWEAFSYCQTMHPAF